MFYFFFFYSSHVLTFILRLFETLILCCEVFSFICTIIGETLLSGNMYEMENYTIVSIVMVKFLVLWNRVYWNVLNSMIDNKFAPFSNAGKYSLHNQWRIYWCLLYGRCTCSYIDLEAISKFYAIKVGYWHVNTVIISVTWTRSFWLSCVRPVALRRTQCVKGAECLLLFHLILSEYARMCGQ